MKQGGALCRNDFECPPPCSGHIQRKIYFIIAIQENLMPDWYRKEIGLSKVRLALTDTLDNGTPMGRAVAKRAAHSIVTKIVNAIAQESNTATSDNS